MARHLVLAGTEKAGTTSVYRYLNAHPEVAGSVRKETDYFRRPPPHSLAEYEALFPHARPDQVRMEASPGYLAESAKAAPAMAALVPWARLLFILRDPIDRLLSGFEFHKSRFHIPASMSFDDYIALCMRFERGEVSQEQTGLKLWHLRVPEAGRYAKHLHDYLACFPREQICVLTLDALQRDPGAFMAAVCDFAGLDVGFYAGYAFTRANATFLPRRAWLQKIGLSVNDALEPFFNRHPAIKQSLLGVYKRLNGKGADKPDMTQATRRLLQEYYRDDVAELCSLFGDAVADAKRWLGRVDG